MLFLTLPSFLKRMLVCSSLFSSENSNQKFIFRITAIRFEELKNLTVELFPTEVENREDWFERAKIVDKQEQKRARSNSGQKIVQRLNVEGHRGTFYNSYVSWRAVIKESHILDSDQHNIDPSDDEQANTQDAGKYNSRTFCPFNKRLSLIWNNFYCILKMQKWHFIFMNLIANKHFDSI